jgi:ABC-type transport system involved in cytochrome c biogenesis permease component
MTDLRVVELKSPTTVWDKDVQADMLFLLERWTEDVKSGKLDALAICGVQKDGQAVTMIAQHNQHPALIGAAAILQKRLHDIVAPIIVE